MKISAKTGRAAAVLGSAATAVVVGAGSAAAAAPSVTMNPAGVLDATGRHVTVLGTYRCDPIPGGTEKLFLTVTQGFAKAQLGGVVVVCTGLPAPYAVTLPTISTAPLLPGAATGAVTIAGSSGSANNSPGQVMVLA